MTQQELGNLLNRTTSLIGRYEKNKCLPAVSVLDKLADIFSVTCDYLTGRTDKSTDFRFNDSADIQGSNTPSRQNGLLSECPSKDIIERSETSESRILVKLTEEQYELILKFRELGINAESLDFLCKYKSLVREYNPDWLKRGDLELCTDTGSETIKAAAGAEGSQM